MKTNWLTYAGIVVSMVTSFSALVVAILSYRRAGKLKKLDLYVGASRADTKLRADYELLIRLHGDALERRKQIAALIGQSRSSVMQQWETEWQDDRSRMAELGTSIPYKDTGYKRMSQDELSKRLVALEKTTSGVNILISKYKGWEAWDKEQGDQFREDQRTKNR